MEPSCSTSNTAQNTSSSEKIEQTFPEVTSEVLTFMKNWLSWMENRPEFKKKTAVNPGYLKLCLNENIFVKNVVILDVMRFIKKPNEMVRRLLLELIGKEKLKTMSVCGKNRTMIPSDVLKAVYSKFFNQFTLT
ncbi:uncharacterized protein LOC127279913 [Leptopilina boulardi]|uniref:uncharacterized protein LOC127279913 n=1 Tax=Leptopilina boulardi TaxID=63433 RepID=UPI0021F62B2A|nr:uncharacterized protein LOC127279913 [Leptopilina boulardi]